jgi:hypothetical protein
VKTTALIALFLLAAGCGDPLTPPWLIEKPRVLGARVEATAEPARPWLRPGEEAVVRWLVAGPDGAPPMGWAFAVCLPDGRDGCGTPLGQMTGEGAPELTFTVPPAEVLGPAGKLLVVGAFCEGGAPVTPPAAPGCQGQVTPVLVTLPVLLERGPESNHNPSLAAATFTIDGAGWPGGTDCAALPRIAANDVERSITFALAGQRETYLSTANPAGVPTPRRESIQLSHFATAGKLPRQLSFIDSKDERDPADVSVKWTPPAAAEVPAAGLLVRFFFVARDLRGGLDWQSRALCVTPNP